MATQKPAAKPAVKPANQGKPAAPAAPAKPKRNVDVASLYDFDSVPVAKAEMPKREVSATGVGRKPKPNPLEKVVMASVNDNHAPQVYGPIPATMEKAARALMYKVVKGAEYGIRIVTVKDETDPSMVRLHFHTTTNRRTVKYSAKDVRTWFESTYSPEDWERHGYTKTGHIPKTVRAAFREVHGHDNAHIEKDDIA